MINRIDKQQRNQPGIYKIYNPAKPNEVYIGSSRNLQHRYNDYCCKVENKNYKQLNRDFKQTFVLDWDNVVFEPICYFQKNITPEIIGQWEVRFMMDYRSNGYYLVNSMLHSNGQYNSKKRSEAAIRRWTDEQRKEQSRKLKEYHLLRKFNEGKILMWI